MIKNCINLLQSSCSTIKIYELCHIDLTKSSNQYTNIFYILTSGYYYADSTITVTCQPNYTRYNAKGAITDIDRELIGITNSWDVNSSNKYSKILGVRINISPVPNGSSPSTKFTIKTQINQIKYLTKEQSGVSSDDSVFNNNNLKVSGSVVRIGWGDYNGQQTAAQIGTVII